VPIQSLTIHELLPEHLTIALPSVATVSKHPRVAVISTASMADPLSIAASVVGLVTVAGKISAAMTSFVLGAADVPESARAALAAIDAMRLTLASVRQLMTKLSKMPRERKEMIHVTHLVVLFREAILSLSELEAIICPASASVGDTTWTWDAVKWLLQEKRITAAVQRLESHRTSLSVMLNILQW